MAIKSNMPRKRLLPVLIDETALTEPDRPLYSIPTSGTIDSYVDITYSQFASAVNRMAWWLEENAGVGSDYPTICFFNVPDISYYMFALAASKVGYRVCS